jgi:hypothetical protein
VTRPQLPGAREPGAGDVSAMLAVLSWLSTPPINWRQVGGEAESVRSQVAATERFVHESLTSVH